MCSAKAHSAHEQHSRLQRYLYLRVARDLDVVVQRAHTARKRVPQSAGAESVVHPCAQCTFTACRHKAEQRSARLPTEPQLRNKQANKQLHVGVHQQLN